MDKVDDSDIYHFRVRREYILNDCIGNVSSPEFRATRSIKVNYICMPRGFAITSLTRAH